MFCGSSGLFISLSKPCTSFCFTFHGRKIGTLEGLPCYSFTLLCDLSFFVESTTHNASNKSLGIFQRRISFSCEDSYDDKRKPSGQSRPRS
jgi:hypothetical protein